MWRTMRGCVGTKILVCTHMGHIDVHIHLHRCMHRHVYGHVCRQVTHHPLGPTLALPTTGPTFQRAFQAGQPHLDGLHSMSKAASGMVWQRQVQTTRPNLVFESITSQ